MTECLLTLSATPGRGGGIKLPHLLGQRFDALAAAIGTDGPFAPEGRRAATAIARFREHLSLRNMLCHGLTEITLDQKGRWTVVIRLAALCQGHVDRTVLVIGEEEAERLASNVRSASDSLSAHLKNLTSGLSVKCPADA